MFIQTEPTPNPDTLKFLPGLPVIAEGNGLEISSHNQAQRFSPLAEALFDIDGIARVFLGRDFVAVSKESDYDWGMLKTSVLAAIMTHFTTGLPVLSDAGVREMTSPAGEGDATRTAVEGQIEDIIDTYIRPAVAEDGGDIVFDRFEDGILYLHMRGACAGCPSATVTLKSGIENLMRHYVPEVLEVRAADPL